MVGIAADASRSGDVHLATTCGSSGPTRSRTISPSPAWRAVVIGAQLFVLHAAAARHGHRHDAERRPRVPTRGSSTTISPRASTTAGSPGSRPSRSRRESPCRSFAARRCARARTRWPTRSRRTPRGRSTTDFRRVHQRSGATPSWTSGAATSCGACVGELRDIPGAILEVGVWRGGTGALMAASAPRPLGIDDPVYLCDTWKGVVKTGDVDTYYRDGKHDDTSPPVGRGAGGEPGPHRNVELLAGHLPDDTGDRVDARTFRLCHSTSTSTSRPRTFSTGCGRGCRPAASSSSTTTASRPAPASPSSSTSSASPTGPPRAPQPQRPWHRRQALSDPARTASYGQHRVPDSGRPIRRLAERRRRAQECELHRRALGDFGCGFRASFARTQLDVARLRDLWSMSRSRTELKRHPKVTAIEGELAEVLPARRPGSFDVVLCLSVLEHLSEPEEALHELRRVTAHGGALLVNVPTWRGKRALEFAAFRLGVSPADEMNDHKRYYDPRTCGPSWSRPGFVRATSAATGTSSASTPSPSAAFPSRDMSRSPRRTSRRPRRSSPRSTRRPSTVLRQLWPRSATAAGGSSCSASADPPRTPLTRSRLPQAVRHRGICADRQRGGADRPHERRGVGDGLLRRGSRERASTSATGCSSSRSEAAASSEAVRQSRPCHRRGTRGGRDGARHRRPRRRLHARSRGRVRPRARRCTTTGSRPTRKASARSSGTSS